MGREKQAVGRVGEKIARYHLTRKGYQVVAANARTPLGEIDLVARDKRTIVFVEVKTRRSASLGPPYLSITPAKKRRMVRSALYFLKCRGLLRAGWRIDVISINIDSSCRVERLEHFVSAVEDW